MRLVLMLLPLALLLSISWASAAEHNSAERETAVLAFVRANHPELAALLEQLKPMRPAEYDRAVREIEPIQRTLASLKERDPKRYEMGLELWKARSRVELLTAKLASAPNPDLERQLHDAVARQLDCEIRQQKLERELGEARIKRLGESIDRLESKHDTIIESRYQDLLKKSQRARRPDGGKPAPARSARTPGDKKA